MREGSIISIVHELQTFGGNREAIEPMIAKQCEMRARLFDGELEFPPFDFLNGDGPTLFDFEKWHACLLGKGDNPHPPTTRGE